MMATGSDIKWTEATWNPVTGCDRISPDCKYLLRRTPFPQTPGNGPAELRQRVCFHPPAAHARHSPSLAHTPASVCELDERSLPRGCPGRVHRGGVRRVNRAYWHEFQVLTKRSARLRELARTLPWTPKIWIGVSIEALKYLFRADDLRQVPPAVRFLSLEPLLAPLPSLDLIDIAWVIVGGESGPGCRPMRQEWVQEILLICSSDKVPLFFKQWGGSREALIRIGRQR